MPLIEYTSFNMSDDLKSKLIQELTKTASEIHGIPIDAFTVIIREVSGPESFGVKGKPLSPR
ncbi:MAG: tautomerase family protein [Candidatus Kariarchaeaceae archaeon]|jgi:phenylpyruvate tautomerase PptA (4-oxalocrotonate tautomerase family)